MSETPEVLWRADDPCRYCGKPLTPDHNIVMMRGGSAHEACAKVRGITSSFTMRAPAQP